jgi:hypothetical protein
MSEQNQQPLDTLQDIKRIMERSSRFISLSGLSGIAAGVSALAGSYFAKRILDDYYREFNNNGYSPSTFRSLKTELLMLAAGVLLAALITAFYFTWRKARHDKQPVWNSTSKRLTINMMIPLMTGGLFVLAMLQYNQWQFVAPSCLVFYGLSLVNASKYTFTDVRYLGVVQIILGLINTQYIDAGLYFWAVGFGIIHIIYGIIMWWKYERKAQSV